MLCTTAWLCLPKSKNSLLSFFFFLFSLSLILFGLNKKSFATEFNDRLTKAYYYFLVGNLASNSTKEAINNLKKAIKHCPESLFLKKYLLSFYLQEGLLKEAEKLGEELYENYPQDKEVIFLLGKVYLSRDRVYKTINILEKYLTQNPKDEQILSLLTSVYLHKKKWKEALQTLQKLLKIDPKNYIVWFYKAKVEQELKDYEAAKNSYLQALELSNYSHGFFLSALKFFEDIKDYPTIEKIIQERLSRQADDAELYRYLFGFYLERKELEKSEEILRKYLAQNKLNPEFLFYLGLTLEYRGKTSDALEVYKSIPQEEVLWYFEGLKRSFFLYLKNDQAKALEILKNFTPREKAHYLFLSQAYDQLDLCEEGERVAKEGLKIYPKDEDLLMVLAGNMACLERYEEVLTLLKPLLPQKADDPYLLNFIGYSLVELNRDLNWAEELLTKAYHLKPDDPYIEDSLAWLYYKKGDYKKALHHLNRAISNLKEDEPVIFEHLGDVLSKLEDQTRACEWYKKAAEKVFRKLEKERIIKKYRACEK